MTEGKTTIRKCFLVLSGKGGVGKSTVACQLAFALAQSGFKVGVLDVDLCGPSVPKILGVENCQIHQSSQGWVPVYTDDTKRLGVVSIAFLIGNVNTPVVWRGPKKNATIKQFINDVQWGELDYMIVDTPPGTSDEHLSVLEHLTKFSPDGALLVTTPQMVSVADVRREITFCKKLNLPILGLFENMSGYVCPHCSECTNIFSSKGGEALCEQTQIPFLGRIPIDPSLSLAGEKGQSFLENNSASSTLAALLAFADKEKTKESDEKESEAISSTAGTQPPTISQ